LETLSIQVLEFEPMARANPMGAPFNATFLGKPMVLPASVRQDWKGIARYKCSRLFSLDVSDQEKGLITLASGYPGQKV
jgi:hypothetical protein